ncbi:hypothetical protein [Streptomyces sennicomposti]
MTLPTYVKNGQRPAPETVFGYISAQSRGGAPITTAATFDSAGPFHADQTTLDSAKSLAQGAGLEVTATSRLGFTVSGPPAAYEELTGGRIESYEVLQYVQQGLTRYVTHLDIVGDQQPDQHGVGAVRRAEAIEAVVLEEPRAPHRLFPPAQLPNEIVESARIFGLGTVSERDSDLVHGVGLDR